jgi:hypothetical protein
LQLPPSPYTAKVRYRWGLPDPFMAYGGDFIFKDLTIQESSVDRTKVRGPDFDYGQGCCSSPPCPKDTGANPTCPKRTNTCQEANRAKREFLHSQHGRAACKLSVSHPLYAFWPRCHDMWVICMPAESIDTRKASANIQHCHDFTKWRHIYCTSTLGALAGMRPHRTQYINWIILGICQGLQKDRAGD